MVGKATLRLPAPLLDRLREKSRLEGRSLNETAVRAIELGLGGDSPDEGWLALGSVLETPPTARYDPEKLRQMRARLGPGAGALLEDLDWARGEE
jgi:hypothetical protein